ncbi:lytic transglycosylase domain-containing protein [Burkholderia sp. AW49-1]
MQHTSIHHSDNRRLTTGKRGNRLHTFARRILRAPAGRLALGSALVLSGCSTPTTASPDPSHPLGQWMFGNPHHAQPQPTVTRRPSATRWAEYQSNRSIDWFATTYEPAREHDTVRTWRLSDGLRAFTSSEFNVAPGDASVASSRTPVHEHPHKPGNQQAKRIEPRVYALAPITGPIADRYQVDHALLMAIIHVESRGDPRAVSHRGAKGLMQLMPRTGAHYGARDLFDQRQNITAGARHLRALKNEYGERLDLVIAAYNAGSGTIRKYGGRVPPYPETEQYVYKVTAYRDAYRARLG